MLDIIGWNNGSLHAQNPSCDLRGGPAAPEADGAETPLRERRQAHDRSPDEPRPEGGHGPVCD